MGLKTSKLTKLDQNQSQNPSLDSGLATNLNNHQKPTTGETNPSAGAGYLHTAWKKCRLAGSPILTGVTKLTAYHRIISDTPPTPVPTAGHVLWSLLPRDVRLILGSCKR